MFARNRVLGSTASLSRYAIKVELGLRRQYSSESPSVCIVGGGLVGMALACGIGEIPTFTTHLLSAAPAPKPRSEDVLLNPTRVYTLTEQSRRLLESVGAWSKLASFQRLRGMYVVSPDGSLDLDFGTNDDIGYVVGHEALEDALFSALSDLPLLETTFGVPVDPHDVLHAQDHCLVVGTDGARSAVRSAAGISSSGFSYNETAVTFTAQINDADSGTENDVAYQLHLESGPLALLPISPSAVSIVWTMPESAVPKDRQEVAESAEEIVAAANRAITACRSQCKSGKAHAIPILSHAVTPPLPFPLATHLASSMTSLPHRVALLGDAAHGVHPYAGQGLNIGLADVACLTELLETRAKLGLSISPASPILKDFQTARGTAVAARVHALRGLYTALSSPVVAQGISMAMKIPLVANTAVYLANGQSDFSIFK